MTNDTYTPLPGSERQPTANARVVGELLESEGRVTVSVVVSDHNAAATSLPRFADDYDLDLRDVDGIFRLTGRVSDLERAFRTKLWQAETEDGQPFRQRTGPIQVPTHLLPLLIAVLGLDDRPVAKGHFWGSEPGGIVTAALPSAYTATQVAQIYSFPPGDGSGRSIAIIELGGGYAPADIQAAGLDPSLVSAVSVDGATNSYSGNPNSADGEVALDVQVVGGIAPRARQLVYFAPNTDAGFVDAVAAALHANPAPDAISISWGAAETGWTGQALNAMESVFAQCVARGIPVFVAAGDGGSDDGTGVPVADFPASAPHATGCGGTVLPSLAGEAVWNDTPGGGSTGGGVSQVFPVPAYQAALGLSGRGVPDLAGNAAPSTGYLIVVNGTRYSFGGTSADAPVNSGLAALLVAALGKPIGDFNSRIYPLIGTAAFHDITQGNNGAYSAKAGWDACTGCGSPNGAALLAALKGSNPMPTYQDRYWAWLVNLGTWAKGKSEAARRAQANIVVEVTRGVYPGANDNVIQELESAPKPPMD